MHYNRAEIQVNNMEIEEINLRLLNFLAKQYPTTDHAITEIINLQAILNLPKATEHFVSDIHGEYEAFSHVLRNASGVLKSRIDEIFINEMSEKERRALAILIYYPEKKMEQIAEFEEEMDEWYRINLLRVIRLCKVISSKYTRSKVRKALPKDFAYIMEELLNEQVDAPNKEQYYYEIVDRIISLNKAEAFMCAFCHLIQRLAIGHLHVLGDIFDRGPRADKVMDILQQYHSVDIQWGNHDIVWMGAAAGSEACIANIIRNACRYSNLETLEDGYGINLLPLATFALEKYRNQDYSLFIPVVEHDLENKQEDVRLVALMHMAITFIQFKLEHQVIQRCFDSEMKNRDLLDQINYEDYTIHLRDKKYQLNAEVFRNINPKAPYELTKEEIEVINRLKSSFLHSNKLQEHIKFLFANGSMYKVYNDNLLYHGCILLTQEGDFKEVYLDGKAYSGKAYLDFLETVVREGYFNLTDKEAKTKGMDMMWYLWCGNNSPLFGKQKMTTFERYFIQDKEAWIEPKNSYYEYLDNQQIANKILAEFGIDNEEAHIINGHVPVRVNRGEKPIKAGGKIIVIDGGFTKAYQKLTGIAGYTLIYNSFGLQLASHEPFEGIEKAIKSEKDMVTSRNVIEYIPIRKRVKDTDIGKEINGQIKALITLVEYYQLGLLKAKQS